MHDSSVLRIQEEPLSITWELLKSMVRVICRPSVFSDVGTSCIRLHIPHMFFSFDKLTFDCLSPMYAANFCEINSLFVFMAFIQLCSFLGVLLSLDFWCSGT